MPKSILLLVYRNLVAAIDKIFLVWQNSFSCCLYFRSRICVFCYDRSQEINQGSSSVTYASFLTAGVIGFNAMNGSIVAGAIVRNDKRNGMLQQLLVMPFGRVQYIISNLITITLVGLASAAAIMIIGLPTIYEDAKITLWSMPYTVYALVMSSILFGSLTITLSTNIRSNEGYNVINNSLFLYFAFLGTSFYAAQGLQSPWLALFISIRLRA